MAQRGRPRKHLSHAITDPVRPTAPPRLPDVDLSLLSEEEKADIRARAEARVIAREKQKAEEAFMLAEEERIERERAPQRFEELRDITIDVALYSPGVSLDGKLYEHGRTYRGIPKSVYDSIVEQQERTFRHERETQSGSPYNAAYTRQRYKDMPAGDGNAYASISANGVRTHNSVPPRF